MTKDIIIKAVLDAGPDQLNRISAALAGDGKPVNLHMTADDVCSHWQFSKSTLERLIRSGRLTPIRVLGCRRFKRSEVEGLGT